MKSLVKIFIFCILSINFLLLGEKYYKKDINLYNIDTEVKTNYNLFFWKTNDTIVNNNWESQFIKIEQKYPIPHLLKEDIDGEVSDNQINRDAIVMLRRKDIPNNRQ